MKNPLIFTSIVLLPIILSCGKKDDSPVPSNTSTTNSTITPPITPIQQPNYFFNVKYKGVTYPVNPSIDMWDGSLNPLVLPFNETNALSIPNCPEFNSIYFQFVSKYDPFLNSSPSLFRLMKDSTYRNVDANGNVTVGTIATYNDDLTGFIGKIPQTRSGSADNDRTLPYRCTIWLSGAGANNYLYKTTDVNYDTSIYYVDITDLFTDSNGSQVKGNFNCLLVNGEVLSGEFYAKIPGYKTH